MPSLLDLTDLPEAQVLDEGTEVTVTVKNANNKVTESGSHYHELWLAVDDHPNVEDIRHVVWIPRENDEPKQVRRTLQGIKQALLAFGLESALGSFDPDDAEIWVDRSAWAVLKQEEYQGIVRNAIASFTVRG